MHEKTVGIQKGKIIFDFLNRRQNMLEEDVINERNSFGHF